MKFRNALVGAVILALPLAAQAQPITGLYVGGGAGVNIMQDESSTVTFPAAPAVSAAGHLPSDVGPAVAISLGYGLGNGLRAEIEGDYRYNTFSGSTGGGAVGGQEQKFGLMANMLYDFVDLVPYVQPYVGVGAGYQWAQDRNVHASRPGIVATANTGTDGEFAYQGIVGVAFPVSGAPGLSVTADYRFMGLVGDRDYSGTVTVARVGIGARKPKAQRRLQPHDPCRFPLRFRGGAGADGSDGGPGGAIAGFPVLSCVLRLGQGEPD